jgi:hypothetical protein
VNKTYKKHVFILYHEVFASRVGWIEEHVFFWVCPVEGVVRRKEKGGYEEHVFFLLFLDRVEGGRRKVGMKNTFFFPSFSGHLPLGICFRVCVSRVKVCSQSQNTKREVAAIPFFRCSCSCLVRWSRHRLLLQRKNLK